MLTVAEIVAETGLPQGAVSILPMSRELGDRMVADERFKLLTFTGSPAVGWRMKARAGKKHVVLELGGNAAVIVDRTADLDWAVKRILVGAFTYAGQVCISVQRMFVHAEIWDPLMERLADGARSLRAGDPLDPETVLGPMVESSPAAAPRALSSRPPSWPTSRPRLRSARRRLSPRSSWPSGSTTSTRRSTPSMTPITGSRRASSRTTWRTPGARSKGSMSVASSSTTCRPIGSTTCHMAA